MVDLKLGHFHTTTYVIKVLYEQTRELTHDFLDYVYCYLV